MVNKLFAIRGMVTFVYGLYRRYNLAVKQYRTSVFSSFSGDESQNWAENSMPWHSVPRFPLGYRQPGD